MDDAHLHDLMIDEVIKKTEYISYNDFPDFIKTIIHIIRILLPVIKLYVNNGKD